VILRLSFLVVYLSAATAWAADRVVSLNLCTDQMLVLLAPEKIAALTPLSRDPSLSFVAAQAEHLPVVRTSAEAVLRLRPDLVLAAQYGAQTLAALLQNEGLPVLRVTLPSDFSGIRQMTRTLAGALGVPQRGEALVTAMDAHLGALPGRDRLRALVWEPRGYTEGPGTLMDAVLRAAGLTNISTGRRISLEAVLRDPPGLLVVPSSPDYPSLATTLVEHPALAGIPRRAIPPALTICPGPFSALAAALLAQ